jgi:MscS family membrane protein
MLSLLGFSIPLPPEVAFLSYPVAQFILNALAWVLIALMVNFILMRLLRFVTRQLPGDLEDIILAILRGPVVLLILIYGAVNSLNLLSLLPVVQDGIRLVSNTLVVLIATHITGRTLRDVIVYYGEKWARRTESKVDDVLIPVLNLFGPVILVLAAALIILPMWGVDVASVLVGAGVVGLVLGLALQETLSNIFSGLSLLVEAPFRTGDLIIAPDGRLCEVQLIGLRSTQMYSIAEHATVNIPNRALAGAILTNVTRPTWDQRVHLDVPVATNVNLNSAQEKLRRIAVAHPAVLVSDMNEKLSLLHANNISARGWAETFAAQDPARDALLDEIERNERVIPRLEIEARLNRQIDSLHEALRSLIRGIKARESKGLSEAERQEIYCTYIGPTENEINAVADLLKTWTEAEEPWLHHSDAWNVRRFWEVRTDLLRAQWERVKKSIYSPDERLEFRLDDVAKGMLEWLQSEFKVVPAYWKNPRVIIKSLDPDAVILELSFYVDNIRLEHDERAGRVRTEIGRQVQQFLAEMK